MWSTNRGGSGGTWRKWGHSIFHWGTKMGWHPTEVENFCNFGHNWAYSQNFEYFPLLSDAPPLLLDVSPLLLAWNFWCSKNTIAYKSYASTFLKVCQFGPCSKFKFLIDTVTYPQGFSYQFTSMGTQKRKYTFIYSDTFYLMLSFPFKPK